MHVKVQVVQKMDNAIHWINHSPVDNMVILLTLSTGV